VDVNAVADLWLKCSDRRGRNISRSVTPLTDIAYDPLAAQTGNYQREFPGGLSAPSNFPANLRRLSEKNMGSCQAGSCYAVSPYRRAAWISGTGSNGVGLKVGGVGPLKIYRRDHSMFCPPPPYSVHSFLQNCCWITLQVSHQQE